MDTDGEIVFGPENIGLDPSEIKSRSELVTKEMNLENLLGRSLFELSGGEKQKIACASVSALLPDIILLDEPSSNLDWGAISELRPVRVEEKYIVKYGEISQIEKVNKTSNRDDESSIIFKDFYFTYIRRPYLFRKKKLTQADEDILSVNIPELSIPKGKVVGVIGKNGIGKSTFLRCVCGLESECHGAIVEGGNTFKGKKRIGLSYMVMQDVNHQLFTDSVESEVLLSMKNEDKENCSQILDSLGLLEYRDKHPMALSGGQKQRVAIASAIAADAKLLLFDEPTSGLDYSHMVKVSELLRELADAGRTVLVSTHDPELIELCCDYVLSINNGKVIRQP